VKQGAPSGKEKVRSKKEKVQGKSKKYRTFDFLVVVLPFSF